MEKWVKATARPSHNLSVYLATSAAPSAPAIVMPQEIFGVIRELRDLADRIAAELAQNIGFLAANPRWQRCEVIS